MLQPPLVRQCEDKRAQSYVTPMRTYVSHHGVTRHQHADVAPQQQAEDSHDRERQHILKVIQISLDRHLSHVRQENQVRVYDELQEQPLARK